MKLKFVSGLIQIASLRFVKTLEGSKITVMVKWAYMQVVQLWQKEESGLKLNLSLLLTTRFSKPLEIF